MKNIIIALVSILLLSGCANKKEINGNMYDTYGILNTDSKKNPNIQYELVAGNVIWSIVLIETIIVPVYMIGFSIYQPVGIKSDYPKYIGIVR